MNATDFLTRVTPLLLNWKETGSRTLCSPKLLTLADEDTTAYESLEDILQKIVVYQFHNTSDTARFRGKWPTTDNRWLKEDAANLAPVLLRLRENESKSYRRIVDTIRLILPFFSDFELEPDYGTQFLLQWRERNSDRVFSVSASLGWYVARRCARYPAPSAGAGLGGRIDSRRAGTRLASPCHQRCRRLDKCAVSTKIQVIVATQSMPLVDCFDPEDIVVVEREGRRSTFRRLESEALSNWLDDYSLSELWEKNVLGGRP